LFSPKAAIPKLTRLDPIQGFKKIFSLKSIIELIKSVAKVIVIAVSAFFTLYHFYEDLFQLFKNSVTVSMTHAINIFLKSALFIAAATILIALIDVPFQLYDHKRKLRMSFQELKDEFKDTEGKPEIKGKIKRLQQEISQRKMLKAVPNADVIITNPEHYSVALSYDPTTMKAPILIAKGIDTIALKIREIGKKYQVPTVTVPPLARSLYYHAQIDREIPEGLYIAIAQILAYIYQLDQYYAGKAEKPNGIPSCPIPNSLRVDDK
jgi:flagellar biosynthetic protein FlhB